MNEVPNQTIKSSLKRKENITAWLLLIPSLIFIIAFTVVPILRSIYIGFTDFQIGMMKPEFIGFGNYIKLFKDPLFWKVVRNSFYFAFLTIVPTMALGLGLAMAVNTEFKGVGFLRTGFFYPVVMPMIAVASIWLFIYMPQAGMLDQVLHTLGLPGKDLLSSDKTVLPAMSVLYIWKEAGYLMIFFLTGLQAISKETYEAAKIDGASAFVTFRKITLPLLMPTFLFVSTIALTNSFKLVDHVVIMTEGAPNNGSTLLLYYIYQNAFTYFDQGIASALTVIMLGIMFSVGMFQFIKVDEKIHYN